MKYAIISAGEGSRLAKEGIGVPKPLVKVGGECLIDRLIRIFTAQGASEIVIICREAENENDPMAMVHEHLQEMERNGLNGVEVPVRHIVKATPSSMHSFYELSKYLLGEPFVLTTVDTIFREDEFADYIAAFESSDCDGLMGVTDYIDDEKPLYVKTFPAPSTGGEASAGQSQSLSPLRGVGGVCQITGFLDADPEHSCTYISGGIYGLKPNAIDTLNRCMASGQSRMRNFQRGLVEDGRKLMAFPFSKVLDIDHASDIEKAERFIVRSSERG